MTTRMLRYEVPVDGQWWPHDITCDPLYVNCRRPDVVEFWAMETSDEPRSREFRVFGTGEPLPEGVHRYCGTTLTPILDGDPTRTQLVWHLFERIPTSRT